MATSQEKEKGELPFFERQFSQLKDGAFPEYLAAFGRGGAAAPNRLFGEGCLSRASSLAILFGAEVEESPWGRARAKMVLGTFAETKVPRRVGTTPHI